MNIQRKHSRTLEHGALTDTCYTTTIYPRTEVEAPGPKADSAYLKALLLARTDGEARTTRVEQLKAQVEAGVYSCDSNQLARILQVSPSASALMGLRQRNRH
ncbi:flagellar biosynthesis anti-sigma factor FlgM [Dictyobacter aurantiacus]|uniref:Anti-sigma-28 factor FlgM C-terminal domain-containing protein n=1 Tax=Dictyobacter aurantiacus TaxID=1936993 RepID=A0A401ZG18_9CHLR|nr:flagellar biosynthesis anti-sigma factor FlgM [Dictyobacter aurantiacus]GCE05821.1 hypothetical protein KDAU_31500 [Dictyobacter aurantiacus]